MKTSRRQIATEVRGTEMVPEGVPLGSGDRKGRLQYVRKKGWLGNVGPVSAKSWGGGGGESAKGSGLWNSGKPSVTPTKRRLAGRVDRWVPGGAPFLPWFLLCPQGLAQNKDTIKDDSVEIVDGHKDGGPTNIHTGVYLICPP